MYLKPQYDMGLRRNLDLAFPAFLSSTPSAKKRAPLIPRLSTATDTCPADNIPNAA